MSDSTNSGSSALLKALEAERIGHLFLVPGGMIDPLMKEFGEKDWKISPIVAAHEGGAAFMADGYGRANGSFGAVAVIGGPGVANMVGALASALADQSQVLALIGEINTSITGKGAFQDGSSVGLDDLAYLKPVTVWAQDIPTVGLFSARLNAGLREMLGTPSGPTALTIPMQILEKKVPGEYRKVDRVSRNPPMFLDRKQASNASHHLLRSNLPMIIAGSGCSHSYVDADGNSSYKASDNLVSFAEMYEIPVATTQKAKGVFPEDHPLSLGVFGYAGSRQAIEAILNHEPDLIIAIGTSLNQRNTMKWHESLSNAKIVHVDVSPKAFERNYRSDVKVRSDASEFLSYLCEIEDTPDKPFRSSLKNNREKRRDWLKEIKSHNRHYNVDEADKNTTAIPIHPGHAVRVLNSLAPTDSVVLVDSGAHRAFVGHYWQSKSPNSYLTATTLAPMGWAIAAAVGAKLARPDRP
ncbi:MAG: thiamine pyrophosphate-binding protein, partial [Hyphomicrobiales bacterium]